MSAPGRGRAGDAEARFAAAKARLDEARRVWAAFLAGMSHELRTPLHGILGFAEVLRDGKAGPLSAIQAEYLGEIIASGEHLLALVNDILDLAMAEAGLIELAPERVYLPEAFVATLRVLEVQTSQKGLRVTTDLAPEVSTIRADPARFRQILYNLLGNAIKFTPEGGSVTIAARKRAEISDCRLQISDLGERSPGSRGRTTDIGLRTTEYIEISVADTGVGIAPEDQATIFEPFGRSGATRPGEPEGARLGLALTRKLVELHGGTLRLESPGRGRGTTATVTLPLPAD